VTIQRDRFLSALQSLGTKCKPASENEIAIVCPACKATHQNNNTTLYANADSGSFICFRCKNVRSRGGSDHNIRIKSLGKLLDLLGLSTSKEALLGEDIPVGSLSEIRQLISTAGSATPQEIGKPLELPVGFRTDWKASHIGSMIYKYLRGRRLSKKIIQSYQIGFVARGDLCGAAIFPVYLNSELRFWQARYVMFLKKGQKYFGAPGIHSHNFLYRYDKITTENITLVEGVFDAISVGGIGIFGKVISDTQIALLSKKKIKFVDVLLDGEASDDAEQIAARLRSKLWTLKRVKVIYLPLKKDPSNFKGDVKLLPVKIF